MVPKTLADRIYSCTNCGLEMDRDLDASLNIRTHGLRGRACQEIGVTDSLKQEALAPLGAGKKSQALTPIRHYYEQ